MKMVTALLVNGKDPQGISIKREECSELYPRVKPLGYEGSTAGYVGISLRICSYTYTDTHTNCWIRIVEDVLP